MEDEESEEERERKRKAEILARLARTQGGGRGMPMMGMPMGMPMGDLRAGLKKVRHAPLLIHVPHFPIPQC